MITQEEIEALDEALQAIEVKHDMPIIRDINRMVASLAEISSDDEYIQKACCDFVTAMVALGAFGLIFSKESIKVHLILMGYLHNHIMLLMSGEEVRRQISGN